jgi:hypothetical protein
MKIVQERQVDFDANTNACTVVRERSGECEDCGCEVYLARFTNTCYCGADYDMSGQRLPSVRKRKVTQHVA